MSAPEPIALEFRMLPIEQLAESKTNPRRRFEKLEELVSMSRPRA